MCGITGIFNFTNQVADAKLLDRMNGTLVHRGPEGEGLFVAGPIGLAHRRLKIIDLSDDANQPLIDKSTGHALVYNGEIYNYLEIRQKLEGRGASFKTTSDSEVLLRAYTAWGTACLEYFNGMFAFAIWDPQKQRLFCARDRLGVKPFYYSQNRNRLIFASEIKALLSHPDLGAVANRSMIYGYLAHGLVDYTDETFFKGVDKLPPGHFLTADRNGTVIERYWDFSVSSELECQTIDTDATQELKHHLKDAVQLRLRSDVPIGSCLSGGIDSTSIVCLINSLIDPDKKKPIGELQKTYSVITDIPRYDERRYINIVTNYTRTKNYQIQPQPLGFLKELDDLLWHQEEPFASTSVYAQWCLFKKIRDTGLKVVLDGQGADEQLCGYRKFSYFLARELLHRKAYSRLMTEGLHAFANIDYFLGMDFKHGLRYFGNHRQRSVLDRILVQSGPHEFAKPIQGMGYAGSMAERIKHDMTRFSLPALLRYEDKNSMAFSIESRTPFLDFRLVEYLAGLPIAQKLHKGYTKAVLRQAMKGIIPEKIRLRRDKLAFDTPQDTWLKGVLQPELMEVFSNVDSHLNCFVNQKHLLQEFNKYLAGRSWLPGNFFFRVFLLDRWHNRFRINR